MLIRASWAWSVLVPLSAPKLGARCCQQVTASSGAVAWLVAGCAVTRDGTSGVTALGSRGGDGAAGGWRGYSPRQQQDLCRCHYQQKGGLCWRADLGAGAL